MDIGTSAIVGGAPSQRHPTFRSCRCQSLLRVEAQVGQGCQDTAVALGVGEAELVEGVAEVFDDGAFGQVHVGGDLGVGGAGGDVAEDFGFAVGEGVDGVGAVVA